MAVTPNVSRYDLGGVRRLLAAATAGGAALALLLAAQAGAAAYLLRREAAEGGPLEALAREVERCEARLDALGEGLPPAEREALGTRIVFLNRILEAGAFSWTGLLAELERAMVPRVRLAEIRRDPATGTVRLQGTAASAEGLSAFTRRLEGRPGVTEVFLVRQSEKGAAGRDGEGGIAFQVSLRYGGAP